MRLSSVRLETSPRRLLQHPVGIVADVAAAFRALVGEADGFWLDSAAPEASSARPGVHYLGRGERLVIAGRVLDTLRAELADHPIEATTSRRSAWGSSAGWSTSFAPRRSVRPWTRSRRRQRFCASIGCSPSTPPPARDV